MKLVVTVDTEEDNWDRYSTHENQVENIERIVPLQRLFDELDVKPTYLVTYPVATNARSVKILGKIMEEGKCEIGMHCHPWNTPPFDGKPFIRKQDTVLCNLSETLVYQKMSTLHESISRNFGVAPVSFRAGRWGLGPVVVRSLLRLGYRFDSSVTPFVNWQDCHGPDFSKLKPDLFRFGWDCCFGRENRKLLEIPVTIGFLQLNFPISKELMRAADSKWGRKLKLYAILSRLGVLNRVWLSPELSDVESMIKLAWRMRRNNCPYLNMTFHSTSLLGGNNSFVKINEEKNFFKKIKDFLLFCRNSGCTSLSLSEFGEDVASLGGCVSAESSIFSSCRRVERQKEM